MIVILIPIFFYLFFKFTNIYDELINDFNFIIFIFNFSIIIPFLYIFLSGLFILLIHFFESKFFSKIEKYSINKPLVKELLIFPIKIIGGIVIILMILFPMKIASFFF